MTPRVKQFYKDLYEKTKSLPNSDALCVIPMYFWFM